MGIGGVETGVRNIAEYLHKKKIRNFVLCESSKKNLKSDNLNIIYLKNLSFKNFLDQKLIKIFLKKLIKQKKINLVHISSRAPAFFLIKFLKKLDVKIVTSVHNKYKSENFLKSGIIIIYCKVTTLFSILILFVIAMKVCAYLN